MFRGELSPRRVLLLMRALPEQSNTHGHIEAARVNEENRARIAKLKARKAQRERLRVVS